MMERRIWRCRRGQALIQGVLILQFIVGLIVLILMSLMALGQAQYYKEKIVHAAEAGARYAVGTEEFCGAKRPQITESDVNSRVTAVVNETLSEMGLPGATTVTVARTSRDGERWCDVTVYLATVRIMAGGMLPSVIAMSATGSESFSGRNPVGLLKLNFDGSRQVVLPVHAISTGMPDQARVQTIESTVNMPYFQGIIKQTGSMAYTQ